MIRISNSTAIDSGAAPRPDGARASQWIIVKTRFDFRLSQVLGASALAAPTHMPPKKKPALFECVDGEVDGWAFKVYAEGKVQVGTAAKGQPYERWSFRLTSYENEAIAYKDHVTR